MCIGVRKQRLAMDKFHGEIGLRSDSVVSSARFIDLCDARMLQPSQREQFVLEAADQPGITQTGLDDFEGYRAPWAILLGLIDNSHAALGEHTQNPISTDTRRQYRLSKPQATALQSIIRRLCRELIPELLDIRTSIRVRQMPVSTSKQRLHLFAHIGSFAAGLLEPCCALVRLELERFVVERFNERPAVRIHFPPCHSFREEAML